MVARRTDSALAAGFTQASLGNAIKQAFLNAGASAVQDFTSGSDRILVFSHVVDTSKTYGTNFLKIRISSSLAIYQQIFTSWNVSTKSGTNGSTEYQHSTISNSSLLKITSLNGSDEYKLVLLSQDTNLWILGTFAPANRPSWWDLNSFSYGFFCTATDGTRWRGSTVNPYSSTEYNLTLGASELGDPNPITNKRDMMIGLLLLSQNGYGVAGKTSDDFAQCAAYGMNRYDSIQTSTNQYLIINPGVGALGIKVV